MVILVREIKLVQRLQRSVPLEENPPLEPVGQGFRELVAHEDAGGDGEDVVELLEGALFGFREPEEDHDEGDDVETRVEAEGADDAEVGEHDGEADGEDGSPEEAGCYGPGHSYLAVGEWEDFSGVGEGDGTFAG